MTLPESEECTSDCPPPKRVKLDETSHLETTTKIGLLSCCDDLMLEMFSYLRPTDLLALSRCCQRIQRVVYDRTLWISVDFRPIRLSHTEIIKYVKFLLPSTNLIATIGPWNPPSPPETNGEIHADGEPSSSTTEYGPSFTGELLDRIKEAAPNITTLILENHIIDSQNITWDQYPKKLEHLSLQRCHVINLLSTKSFFFGIDRHLPHLKTLDLSGCRWFESHSFLALSKCKQLEELRLADCVISDFVPYVSLGTRFGFKALTVVDFRRTWVSDREVSCLNKTPTLRELYLEAPTDGRAATLITDLAVTAFGGTLEEWNEMGYFVVLMSHYEGFMPSPLRVIELCNYTSVTDTSLRHCASCLKGLKRLNVKGTSCTEAGVIKFRSQRPDVNIVSNFDLEVDDSCSKIDNT